MVGPQSSQEYAYYIKELAKIEHLTFVDGGPPGQSAVGVYKGIEVFVPLKDLIDVAKEMGRIAKELQKIEEDSEKLLQKLNNPSFREKAPPEVIAKNKGTYDDLIKKKEKLV